MRPAVFHCFGRDKSGAKTTLRAMALEGWETLLAVLLGVGHLRRMDSVWGNVLAWLCLRGNTQCTLAATLDGSLETFWPASRASVAVV